MRAWIFFIALTGIFCEGSVRLAFLELKKWNGEVLKLESDFPFAHVAITDAKGWWHAHPQRGVEYISHAALEEVGRVKLILELLGIKGLDRRLLALYKGLPYDSEFTWSDDKVYCSELVAKLLGIEPVPMHFDPDLWPLYYQKLEGMPGISPGGIYRAVVNSARHVITGSTR